MLRCLPGKAQTSFALIFRMQQSFHTYVKGMEKKYLGVCGDITKTADIQRVVDETVKEMGKIDVLVNCAGIGFLEMASESTEKVWDMTMAVNLTGSTRMALAVGQKMIENGGGSIINIASQAGVVALERHLAYGTAKAGIIQMTKQLALEWGKYNVRINAISPTIILTKMGEMNWNNEKERPLSRLFPPDASVIPRRLQPVPSIWQVMQQVCLMVQI